MFLFASVFACVILAKVILATTITIIIEEIIAKIFY
jgi:hypothetical protein